MSHLIIRITLLALLNIGILHGCSTSYERDEQIQPAVVPTPIITEEVIQNNKNEEDDMERMD